VLRTARYTVQLYVSLLSNCVVHTERVSLLACKCICMEIMVFLYGQFMCVNIMFYYLKQVV